MSISEELYTRVCTKLRAVHPEPHLKRIANWVWVIVGLILSQSVHLSQIAQHIPSAAQAATMNSRGSQDHDNGHPL